MTIPTNSPFLHILNFDDMLQYLEHKKDTILPAHVNDVTPCHTLCSTQYRHHLSDHHTPANKNQQVTQFALIYAC